MEFFAARGEYPAAGLFSGGHLFMLVYRLYKKWLEK